MKIFYWGQLYTPPNPNGINLTLHSIFYTLIIISGGFEINEKLPGSTNHLELPSALYAQSMKKQTLLISKCWKHTLTRQETNTITTQILICFIKTVIHQWIVEKIDKHFIKFNIYISGYTKILLYSEIDLSSNALLVITQDCWIFL